MGTTLHTTTIQTLPPTRHSLPVQPASAVYPRVPAVMVWLAAAIALAVLASRWIDLESGLHLMLVWLFLWAIVGSSFLLLAGTVQRMVRRAQASWMTWAQARAEAADWHLAMSDHRVSADLEVLQHRTFVKAVEAGAFNADQDVRPESGTPAVQHFRRSLTVQA
ncbi:MAG: hypothetical protein RLZZ591_1557 [Pseudomonadota bacterium]